MSYDAPNAPQVFVEQKQRTEKLLDRARAHIQKGKMFSAKQDLDRKLFSSFPDQSTAHKDLREWENITGVRDTPSHSPSLHTQSINLDQKVEFMFKKMEERFTQRLSTIMPVNQKNESASPRMPTFKSNEVLDRRASIFTGAKLPSHGQYGSNVPKCLTDGTSITAKFANRTSESVEQFLDEIELQLESFDPGFWVRLAQKQLGKDVLQDVINEGRQR